MPLQLDLAAAVLFSALLHALWNSFVKVGRDRLASIAVIVAAGGLLSAPVAAMVPLPAAASLPFVAASVSTPPASGRPCAPTCRAEPSPASWRRSATASSSTP